MPFGMLVLLWGVLIFAIDPRGEFPLNDDWAYIRMLMNLVQGHRLLPVDAMMMPLIGQVVWSIPFTFVFDSIFIAARSSVLLLGLAGGLATYGLVRETGGSRAVAWLAAASLLTNPLWLSLSCTYMTDLPFVALSTCAVFAFTRAHRRQSGGLFVAGVLLLAWASLIRQVGLAFACGVGVAVLTNEPRSWRSIARAATPLAVCAAAVGLYTFAIAHTVGLPQLYGQHETELFAALERITPQLKLIAIGAIAMFLYVGFALVPLLPLRRRTRAVMIGAPVVFGGLLVLRKMLPITGNILTVTGVGATTVAGAESLPSVPMWVRAGVTFAAIIAALEAIRTGFLDSTSGPARFVRTLAVVTVATYVAVMTQIWMYDRYVLTLAPLVLVATLPRSAPGQVSKATVSVVLALIAVQGAIGVVGTRDYFAWNRARWRALADLSREHVPPSDIDGGLEFNGWSAYDPNRPLGPGPRWWDRQDAEYLIAFRPVAGWIVVAEYPYSSWLPGRRSILTLRKSSVSPARSAAPYRPAHR